MAARNGSEVEPAVTQVEALVAEREIGDGLLSQREGEAGAVVEGRVGDLVAAKTPRGVRDGDMENLAAPSLHQRGGEVIRRRGGKGVHGGAERRQRELFREEFPGPPDLEPS